MDWSYGQSQHGNHDQNRSPDSIVSSNDRKPVYVSNATGEKDNSGNERNNISVAIGDKGEDYILSNVRDYLLTKDNTFEKAPVNNEGFDIVEKNDENKVIRYIEVKTLTGRWGEGGVGLTPPQLRFAQSHKNWWLFVVENMNTNNTTVFTFENPVQDANKFMFDHSWKQLAVTNQNYIETIPKEGEIYDLGESDNLYTVLDVKKKGKFYRVKLQASETLEVIKKKFKTEWKKIQ